MEIAGVVRLVGDEHRAAFWQREDVIRGVAISLRRRLAGFGYRVKGVRSDGDDDHDDGRLGRGNVNGAGSLHASSSSAAAAAAAPVLAAVNSQDENKEEPGSRLEKPLETSASASASSSTSTNALPNDRPSLPSHEQVASKPRWRTDDEDALSRRKLEPDEARVLSKAKDVSFRTVNIVGLYETVTEKALWLQIEIGV